MLKSLLSKKTKKDFYTIGKEIKINKNALFSGFGLEKDSISTCKARIVLAMALFGLAFFIIFIRLFVLSIVPNISSSSSAHSPVYQETSYYGKIIKRADIVDVKGNVVATSLPTVNLYVDTKKLMNVEESALALHEVIPDVKYEDILRTFKRRTSFAYIKRNLTPTQQHQINALGIPGLEFENGEKRVYPHGCLFSHIVGKANLDNDGISGLELGLNKRLTESDIPLKLTIDAGIQYTIREKLLEGVEKFKAEGAVAILMDVNTGEVISMVSLPDFDPNDSVSPSDMFNFATKGLYESGSVFKVFNTAMALDSGKIKKNDEFDASQPLKMHYHTIKDYRGQKRWLSVEEVLVYSSNIGSAQIALAAGKEEQQSFLRKIGLMEALDIEIAEKATPIVPKRWGDETVATIAYGYSMSVTPLHVVAGFASIINGGLYNVPKLVRRSNPEPSVRVISEKTSKTMQGFLRSVVVEGSAKSANIEGYDVGGKTGTANKLVNGKYANKKVMTTFVGVFPMSKPKYALYVMLDEPKGLKETWNFTTSGWNAAPVGGSIIKSIAPQLNVPANYAIK